MMETISAMAEAAQRYAAAALGVAVTLLLVLLLWPAPELASTTLVFVLPVAAGSFYGGPGPGVLAAILAGFSIDSFLMKPNSYSDAEFGDAVRLAIFILTALLLAWLRRALQEESGRRRQLIVRLEEAAAFCTVEDRVAPTDLRQQQASPEPPPPAQR